MSEEFIRYTLCGVRISGEKGASQGRQEKGTIVGMAYKSGSANVLYFFDGNAVRYCFELGSLDV